MQRLFISVCVVTVSIVLFTGADWRQFRGTNTDGVSPDAAATSWDKPAWSADLPGRGLSGPIVVGDRVYVTASSGYRQDRLHVLCFAAGDGEQLWERQFWATGRTMCHPKTSVAAPTPASDGERIVAFYSTNDLACLDLDGNLQWYRGLTHDFPNASNSLGMASSPVVVGDTVVVQVESDDESFATGLDLSTGIARWKIDRPRRANWTSAAILRGKSRTDDLVLLQSSEGLTAVEPQTGKTVWSYDDGASTIPSSVVSGGTVYVPSHGLTALKPIPESDAPAMLWQIERLSPSTPSPVVLDERVFTVNRAGVVACADTENGQLLWQLRLKGPFSGTPVAAGGHLYFVNEAGLLQIVKPGAEDGEIVFSYDFGETVLCSPAVADGAVYVRSDGRLWKAAR